MNASEKLRAIGNGNRRPEVTLGAGLQLLDALPLIVDVIEAVEPLVAELEHAEAVATAEVRRKMGYDDYYATFEDGPHGRLRVALIALREHLEQT